MAAAAVVAGQIRPHQEGEDGPVLRTAAIVGALVAVVVVAAVEAEVEVEVVMEEVVVQGHLVRSNAGGIGHNRVW